MEEESASCACTHVGARAVGRKTKTGRSSSSVVARLKLPRAWTAEEDARLRVLAKENGFAHWHRVARRMTMMMPAGTTGRSARACRDRWRHHLARDVYHRPFTARDDQELRRLVWRLGCDRRSCWKEIGRAVYGRTARVMRQRWREIRHQTPPAAAAKKSGGAAHALALPSEDDDDDGGQDLEEEEIADAEAAAATVQQKGTTSCYYAMDDDVLASTFASCNLAVDASMDPRAGSLALGFACMAV